jgi:predicted PurR-regulated permease PerM
MTDSRKLAATDIASYVLAALALLLVLQKGLVAALLSGLLVYSLIHLLSPMIARKISDARARLVTVALIAVAVIGALSLAIWGAVAFFKSDAGSMHSLLQRLADIIEASRSQFPAWIKELLPDDSDELSDLITRWFREHAAEAKLIGAEAGRTAAHALVGMIIGAMVAMYDAKPRHMLAPLTAALHERLEYFVVSFRNIFFAQVWISVINTVISAAFIFIVLPMAGISLPLSKSLIAITFIAGLLPVVGNLISNTMLVIVSLSHSLNTAFASLLFMVVVHKLEYFLNARIIGSHINARSWELLVVMLVMETAFGLPGVIAAPVFYAYIKKELTTLALI